MRGHLINNPNLEFLGPVLERWVDCIDRCNQFFRRWRGTLLARRGCQCRGAGSRGVGG